MLSKRTSIARLQPVDYRSRRVAEQLGELTVGWVILLEPRAFERQRRNRAVVVMDGAEFSLGVNLEHGALGGKVDSRILKTIEDWRLTQRGEGVGITGAHTLGSRHSIHEDAFASLAGG